MHIQERLDRITTAQAEIRAVLGTLDTSTYDCDACGTRRHRRWKHKLMADALEGATSRLQKALEILTGAPERPAKETDR